MQSRTRLTAAYALLLYWPLVVPAQPVDVCGPPFKFEPAYDPPRQDKWQTLVLRQSDARTLDPGPYPKPVGICADVVGSPVAVWGPKNAPGVDPDPKQGHATLFGSCMVIRVSDSHVNPSLCTSSGTNPPPIPGLDCSPGEKRYVSWSKCGGQGAVKENVRVGHRIQYVRPNFPTSIAPLDRPWPIRAPMDPKHPRQHVIISQPATMVVEVCVPSDVRIFYSEEFDPPLPVPDNKNKFVDGGACRTIEARAIWLQALKTFSVAQRGSARLLRVKE